MFSTREHAVALDVAAAPVRVDGLCVEVEGLDAIDGTPVLDVKPVMRDFLPRGEQAEPAWCAELMSDYWRRGN